MHVTQAAIGAMRLVETHRPDIFTVLKSMPIKHFPIPGGTIAAYNPDNLEMAVNNLLDHSPESLAATLIHEGTHALDHKKGILVSPDTSPESIAGEQRAFRASAEFWQLLYPYGKMPEYCELDAECNEIMRHMHRGSLDGYVHQMYSKVYSHGPHGQGCTCKN